MSKTTVYTIEYGYEQQDKSLYAENREHFVVGEDYYVRLAELIIRYSQRKDNTTYYVECYKTEMNLTKKQFNEIIEHADLSNKTIITDKLTKQITIKNKGE